MALLKQKQLITFIKIKVYEQEVILKSISL